MTVELSLLFGADFADIFEVKDGRAKQGRHHQQLIGEGVVLGYERDGFRRQTAIRALRGGSPASR